MGDVKTRFTLEGEQQYRAAMTDAANAIKLLNSQQRLAAAEFKNTGDAEKYASQQTEILQQKIAQQQAIVKAAESALKELSANGVSENSRQFQQWQGKLLNAKTQLTNMETQLKSVTDSMRNAATDEEQYKAAMTNAANAIKVLNTQQKLAAAQFKNTGDAEKYAQQQTEILKQKIEQQQKIVKAAENALKELADKGVKENSEQFQQWQVELLNAQTALTNMETELKNVTEPMQETTNYAEDTASAVESIGKKVSFDAVIGGLGKVTNAMQSAARMAKDLTVGLFNSTRDAAAWADELATNAIVYGFSTDELQGMALAAQLADTSAEAIVKARQKLATNLKYGSDDVKEAFKELGVFTGVQIGQTRTVYQPDIMDIFWDIGQKIINADDGVRDVEAMSQKIFGRGWMELKPLFTYGREEYESLVESASKVPKEQLDNLLALDDAMQKLTYEWDVTKRTLLAELAPAFEAVSNAVTGLLTQFNEYLKTEEGQEKLEDLSQAVTDLFNGLSDVDFSAALDTAKGALDAITDGLGWIKDNKDGIVKALKGIAIGFLALKLSSVGLQIGQTVSGLKELFGGGNNKTPTTIPTEPAPQTQPTAPVPQQPKAEPEKTAGNPAEEAAKDTAGEMPKWMQWASKIALVKTAAGIADYMPGGSKYTIRDPGGEEILASEIKYIPITEEEAEEIRRETYRQKHKYFAQAQETFAEMQKLMRSNSPISDVYRQIGGAWASGEGQGEVLRDIASRYGAWLNGADDAGMDALIDTLEDATTAKLEGMLETFYQNQNGEWETTGLDPQAVTDLFEEMSRQLEAAIVKDPPVLQFAPDIEKLQIDLNNSGLTVPLTPYLNGSITDYMPKANGIAYVPFDGYPAILHKGERVMTARENMSSYSSNLYVESMYMNGGTDAAGLAAAMAAAQRRTMAGYGS